MRFRLAFSALVGFVPLALASNTTAPWTSPRARTCVPQLEEGRVYNVFQAGRAAQVWEFLPPSEKPGAVTGGAVYVSETDTPENGGFFIREGLNGTYTLSLASQEEGVQCVRTVGKDRPVTTGPCDLEKAQFTLSCTTCPPTSSSPPSPAAAEGSPSITARACIFSSLASPGYALYSVLNSDSPDEPGLATVELRKQAVRSARQSWDLVLSEQASWRTMMGIQGILGSAIQAGCKRPATAQKR